MTKQAALTSYFALALPYSAGAPDQNDVCHHQTASSSHRVLSVAAQVLCAFDPYDDLARE